MFFGMEITIIGPLLPEISRTFSFSLAQSGFIFTANFIGLSAFILLGGIAADRWGKKKVLAISLAGMSISLLVFPLSSSFYILCMIIIFIGGFGGIVESISNALIADINTVNTSFFINVGQVFFGIGALAGPITAGVVVSSGMPWWYCYAGLGIILAALTLAFSINRLPSNLPVSAGITWSSLKNLIIDWKFMLICLCMILYTGSEVGGWGWMSTFLKQNMDFTIEKSSIAVSIFWLAVIVGRLLLMPLMLKFSVRILTVALAGLSAVISVISGIVSSEAAVWCVITAMGIAYSSQWALIAAYGNSIYKTYTGTVFALFVGSGGIGAAIIPLIMGVIGQYINIRAAMISPAIFFFALGLIFLLIEKIQPRQVNL